jgi:type IV secretory pathway component VirB8
MSSKESETVKYSALTAEIMEQKLYFGDAMDWYCLKYLSVISERTFFIMLSTMSFLIVIFLILTIKNILPLKESFPVLVTQRNSANYFSTIKSVKPMGLNYNSNEAILRLLLLHYTRELFSHNYRSGKIDDLNKKLSRVKLYSSDEAFHKFKQDFTTTTTTLFNKNLEQRVVLKTFKFRSTSTDKKKFNLVTLQKYLTFKSLPEEAEIDYDLHLLSPSEKKITPQKILLRFKFEAIKYNKFKKSFDKPVLTVSNYEILPH